MSEKPLEKNVEPVRQVSAEYTTRIQEKKMDYAHEKYKMAARRAMIQTATLCGILACVTVLVVIHSSQLPAGDALKILIPFLTFLLGIFVTPSTKSSDA